jgi:hypothetical protein
VEFALMHDKEIWRVIIIRGHYRRIGPRFNNPAEAIRMLKLLQMKEFEENGT